MKRFPKTERRLHNLVTRVWLAAMMSTSAGTVLAGSDDAWQFEVTPYAWAAGLDGTVSINNRPAGGLGVDQSFSDIL